MDSLGAAQATPAAVGASEAARSASQRSATEVRRQRAGTLWLDNVAKLVCDALNGICWADDAQVTSLIAEKEYGDQPRLDVMITRLA
jgi:Holliday junction resolvase RusA-like endonuclease